MKNIDIDGKRSNLKETSPGKGDQIMAGEDDEESDDESFDDKGPDGSDDDEEDSEDEDFSDADGSGDDDMSELDKAEIKELVKDAGEDNLGSKRPPRRAARK